ncbi:MAG: hypothetical protein [Bacteriophage sp.]|jgi:hypothetical protein|nr:MAG: hypothetical protein [Bacteriophage sp.]UVN02449.1 MAG: hypothetical protein [Bacteriophage sp.]UVX41960.1 MAG: hypothetical protein [Bacteriophage sp.]UWI10574.1 MAG: hypothetical protein [Bacteriophage sp.]DAL51893.1 MAG TPA_asm: hypothetical protein [Caudoviricetes sp.]
MKKKLVMLLVMALLVTIAYHIGTAQADTIVPDGYIRLDECIPLDDIAYYFIDNYDYPCFELKDTLYQLEDRNNASYEEIMKKIPSVDDLRKEGWDL